MTNVSEQTKEATRIKEIKASCYPVPVLTSHSNRVDVLEKLLSDRLSIFKDGKLNLNGWSYLKWIEREADSLGYSTLIVYVTKKDFANKADAVADVSSDVANLLFGALSTV